MCVHAHVCVCMCVHAHVCHVCVLVCVFIAALCSQFNGIANLCSEDKKAWCMEQGSREAYSDSTWNNPRLTWCSGPAHVCSIVCKG